jgi:hypothetical protein
MRITLQVSEERCAKCGKVFRALRQSPHDYGIAAFVSERGRVAIAVADDDIAWQEAATLLNAATDRPRSDYESANCFPHLFNRTVDEIDGERLYMWGDVPCPQCGSFERAASGLIEPPEFVNVNAEAVTHHRWRSLSAEEKRRQVDEAMKACRAEIAALIAMSRAASR